MADLDLEKLRHDLCDLSRCLRIRGQAADRIEGLEKQLAAARDVSDRRQKTNLELVDLTKDLENQRDAERAARESLEGQVAALREALAEWDTLDREGFMVTGLLDRTRTVLADTAAAATELVQRIRREAAEPLREALREIRGCDDTWAHRGHEPGEVGHECRMCWIMRTVARALAGTDPPPEKEVADDA